MGGRTVEARTRKEFRASTHSVNGDYLLAALFFAAPPLDLRVVVPLLAGALLAALVVDFLADAFAADFAGAFFAVELAAVFFAVDLAAVVLVPVLFAVPDPPPPEADFETFFAPLTTSLKFCPALNFGTVVFLILTDAPVLGLRPVRAGRATRSKTPNPVIATRSPLATARVMVSMTASTASVALRLPPRRSDSVSIIVALFTYIPSE